MKNQGASLKLRTKPENQGALVEERDLPGLRMPGPRCQSYHVVEHDCHSMFHVLIGKLKLGCYKETISETRKLTREPIMHSARRQLTNPQAQAGRDVWAGRWAPHVRIEDTQ